MKKNIIKNQVELQALLDKKVITHEQASTRILEISIIPPKDFDKKERAALNLSLVLDHSGSMSGEKLHFVKQAAAHVIDLLDEKDRTSVIIYDDQIKTVFPPEFMTDDNKTQAKTNIQQVRSGGSTNLSGGWLKGCEDVAIGATNSTINRTLLLTDGLANIGIQDIDELSTHSRELFNRGVSTSCFGVGLGYNEHMLEQMANSGGGNFHFLETLNAIPLVFEREFEELVNIGLRDTEVIMQLPTYVKAEVSAGWQYERVDDQLKIFLGSLNAGRKQSIYIKLHFNKDLEGDEISLPIIVRGKGEGEIFYDVSQTLSVKIKSSSEEKSMVIDQLLMKRFALVDMADKANEALKQERAGDRIGASRRVRNSLAQHSEYMSTGMIDKFQFMSSEMNEGLSEEARKRHHREEYENKRGREIVRDYQLNLVNGHLITRIEGLSVLIDTGVPISVGDQTEWYFLNEVHKLSQGYMGVTLEYLNKMVGTRVDILLGTDIMRKYHITLNLSRNDINFSTRPLIQSGIRIPIETFMGVPSIQCLVDGKEYEMFVDTGAKLSYVTQQIASHYPSIGKEQDFYPGMGEFETSVYEIPLQVGKLYFTLRCGVLPQLLEMSLGIAGKSGIIGSELYQKYLVDLAFPDNEILLKEPL
jgi:Ca-activated chloride channel homolog